MFVNVLNSKFMNERQAKLSVHERNLEFMNEMNIHAEVHERPLSIYVLYMREEKITVIERGDIANCEKIR